MANVSLEFLGRQMAEMRDDIAVLAGMMRQVMGRLDGIDARLGSVEEQLKGIRGELGAIHRREFRRATTLEEIEARLAEVEPQPPR